MIKDERSGNLGIDDQRHNPDGSYGWVLIRLRCRRQPLVQSWIRSCVRYITNGCPAIKGSGKIQIELPKFFPLSWTNAVFAVVTRESHTAILLKKNCSSLQA